MCYLKITPIRTNFKGFIKNYSKIILKIFLVNLAIPVSVKQGERLLEPVEVLLGVRHGQSGVG